MTTPKYILGILDTLGRSGYDAYLVGGCVRDLALLRRPGDWDIASSAPPEKVLELFPHTVPTGIKHGTVTVVTRGGSAEVTAFRRESGYSDHRRPDQVSFTSDIRADLSRRDFTVNAQAMDISGHILDPFGGRADIERRLIRCVGDPEERFGEDALRMLRALRFCAQLGFETEAATLSALLRCAPLCAALAPERVRDELIKTLMSPRPQVVCDMLRAGLLSSYVSPGQPPELKSLALLPLYARWAHLCMALEGVVLIMSTRSFLSALRLDGKTVNLCTAAVEVLKSGSRDWKRLLRRYGRDAVIAAYPKNPSLRAVLRSGECYSVSQLAIGGDELAALGLRGREIGQALDRLLEHVIDCPADNRSGILCKLAKAWRYGCG